jgi:phage shock protein PspC (stress-responsive transcriptional regulator)
MQKVITINLNGNTYQLDEDGYDALRAYLKHAEAQLRGDPDTSEIIRDLEQSIAENCLRLLGPGKSVVTTVEVEQILREIGPVESGAAHAPHSGASPQASAGADPPPRRLYQIREGAMLSGVCNGLAAYWNVDPTIVRVAFVAAFVAVAKLRGDEALLVVFLYLLLMFIVPYAKTTEQRAAAQGASAGLPYKLQNAVERVKARFDGLHHKAH